MNQRNNFKYIYNFYKQTTKTQKYKLMFILSIILSIYGIIQLAYKLNYSIGFIRILTFGFYIVSLLLILLFNLKLTYDNFNSNYMLIARFKTQKKYLFELIKNICFSNFCLFIINIILLMIGLNIFNSNKLMPSQEMFTIKSNYYIIYVIIKFLIFSQIISIINVLLLKMFNNKIIIILNFILYALIIAASKNNLLIVSIKQIPLFIGDYLMVNVYSSFLFEVCCFLLYISFLFIVLIILAKLVLKKERDIVNEIYID